ncbi:hypothetical protein NRI63_004708 [Salmonella enterica]|nr:hypothetical protein [Salmonella enterica]ELQ6863929.1 hypothetical protein [Salmonella enterica]
MKKRILDKLIEELELMEKQGLMPEKGWERFLWNAYQESYQEGIKIGRQIYSERKKNTLH